MKEDAKTLEISGRVSSGLGEGSYFMSKKGYLDQMREKLSMDPYPGTFNVNVSRAGKSKVDMLKKSGGILIKGFKEGEKAFGDVIAFKAELSGMDCAVIFPKLSTHTDKIEIIAEKELRKELKLTDGDKVTITVFLS
jgi:riboflavin kinase, archaea type